MIALLALTLVAAGTDTPPAPSTCSIESEGRVRTGRCMHSVDADGGGAVPLRGRRSIMPGVDAISIVPYDPGHAQMRILTPGGINSASGDLMMEDGARCWQGSDMRVCFGPRRAAPVTVLREMPADLVGRWAQDPTGVCGSDVNDVEFGSRHLVSGGDEWRIVGIARRGGVLRVRAVSTVDGQRFTWIVAPSRDGGLLARGVPNVLQRCAAGPDAGR